MSIKMSGTDCLGKPPLVSLVCILVDDLQLFIQLARKSIITVKKDMPI